MTKVAIAQTEVAFSGLGGGQCNCQITGSRVGDSSPAQPMISFLVPAPPHEQKQHRWE